MIEKKYKTRVKALIPKIQKVADAAKKIAADMREEFDEDPTGKYDKLLDTDEGTDKFNNLDESIGDFESETDIGTEDMEHFIEVLNQFLEETE
jgi:hypothetical protein